MVVVYISSSGVRVRKMFRNLGTDSESETESRPGGKILSDTAGRSKFYWVPVIYQALMSCQLLTFVAASFSIETAEPRLRTPR